MPTARELTREEWKRYRGPASHLTEYPGVSEGPAHEQLMVRVRAAAALLKTRFAARRVILFGSLAHAAWFTPDSDVDLAVEGLNGRDYWRGWKSVEEILENRPVDLIDLEFAGESLRRAIERHGVEL